MSFKNLYNDEEYIWDEIMKYLNQSGDKYLHHVATEDFIILYYEEEL